MQIVNLGCSSHGADFWSSINILLSLLAPDFMFFSVGSNLVKIMQATISVLEFTNLGNCTLQCVA